MSYLQFLYSDVFILFSVSIIRQKHLIVWFTENFCLESVERDRPVDLERFKIKKFNWENFHRLICFV